MCSWNINNFKQYKQRNHNKIYRYHITWQSKKISSVIKKKRNKYVLPSKSLQLTKVHRQQQSHLISLRQQNIRRRQRTFYKMYWLTLKLRGCGSMHFFAQSDMKCCKCAINSKHNIDDMPSTSAGAWPARHAHLTSSWRGMESDWR